MARPSAEDWAEYLKRHGGFHGFGRDCFILPDSVFTDPGYTVIGNNVWIVGAWISGHDGGVIMLNRAYGKKLDAVGPVIIKDDVFNRPRCDHPAGRDHRPARDRRGRDGRQ